MSITSSFKPKASYGTSRSDSDGVLTRAKMMYAAIIIAIASFPNLPIAMAAFKDLIDAMDTAQQATKKGTRGLASARNIKRDALWAGMELLRVYVQGLADQISIDGAKALIETAGLLVANSAAHVKPILEVKVTTTPGRLLLFANAGMLKGKTSKSTTFHWQWSADGKSWTSLASTPISRTEISGLAVPGEYWFRVSVTLGKDVGPWTDAVPFQIH